MAATLLDRAAAKLKEIVAQYNLTRYFDTDEFSNTRNLCLTAAADNIVHIWDYGRSDYPRAAVTFQQGQERDLIYALAVAKTNTGSRIVVGTRFGKLCLLDSNGYKVWEIEISKGSIWHVTSAQINGQMLIFVCSMDQQIRIFDLSGKLRCTMQAPGRLLSLDVRTIDGQTLLVGGTQERNWIYIWQLEETLKRQTAMPSYVLTGGQKPAFCTKFVELAGEVFVVHSSWDGHLYLYGLHSLRKRVQNPPSLTLDGDCPLYAVEATQLDGRLVIYAGSALGRLYAWSLPDVSAGPRRLIADLGLRIRAMRVAHIEGQVKLFAGGHGGQLFGFDLDRRFEEWIKPTQILQTGCGDITGIGVFQDLR